MSQHRPGSNTAPTPGDAGCDVREQVEAVGVALAESCTELLDRLPGRQKGPQALADQLDITIVTASRLLKAVSLVDPIAVVEQIPGTVPLRRIVEACILKGAPKALAKRVSSAIDDFDTLIRTNAGHRSSLNAMLTDWLPQSRREFETRRRQSAYKAISELKGINCELDLASIILFPSEEEDMIDLLSIQGSFGLDRLRPSSMVHFGTLRSPGTDQEAMEKSLVKTVPMPITLDGEPATDGLHSVRLDQFCTSTPAPMESKRFGRDIQYSLGQTGFGPDSSVDFVMAEVNRAEIGGRTLAGDPSLPYFFQVPATPAKAMLFDLLVHRDVYADGEPELLVYDTSVRGPARAGSPEREVDLIRGIEEIEVLGFCPSRLRFAGFPRYREMLDFAFGKLGLEAEDFRAYRVHITYPLHATQVCMKFSPA